MNKPLYYITFLLNGVRFHYNVYAYDFDVTYENCLTMYFREGGRIVVDLDMIEELEIKLINQ